MGLKKTTNMTGKRKTTRREDMYISFKKKKAKRGRIIQG